MMYLNIFKNWVSILISKLLIKFGKKYSTKPIPEGLYCYIYDSDETLFTKGYININPCKYYKWLGGHYNGCKYLGIVSKDFIFADQCKICGENYGIDE